MFVLYTSLDAKRKDTTPAIHNVDYVFASKLASINLKGVEQTDTTTNIYFSCKGVPGDIVGIPHLLYLDDMQHNIYRMLSSKNIVPGQSKTIPLSGEFEFMLSFEPLKDGMRVFDLLSVSREKRSFAFWGVHAGKYRVKTYIDKYSDYGNLKLVSSGETVIRGTFKSVDGSIIPDSVRVIHTLLDENAYRQKKRNNKGWSYVGDDGTFELSEPVDGVSWAYVDMPGNDIPIMLYPGDTIELKIDITLPFCYRTEYNSYRGYNELSHLMDADPRVTNPLYLTENYSDPAVPDVLIQKCKQARKDVDDLLSYLVKKYSLSDIEAHLLHLELYTDIDCYQTHRLTNTIDRLYRRDIERQINETGAISADYVKEVKAYLSYLKDINLRDMYNYVLPSKGEIINMSNLPFVFTLISCNKKDLVQGLIQQYFDTNIPSWWYHGLQYYYPGNWKIEGVHE